MGEVNRRRFLERMTALTATAVATPATLGAIANAGSRFPGETRASSRVVAGHPDELNLPPAGRPQPAELTEFTLAEAARLLRDGDVGAVELVEAYLARIGRWDARYQAFNTVASRGALEAARTADRTRGRAPLTGVPLAIKDNYFTAGVRTTANSFIFEDFVPDFDATSWARLRDAGAILLGKTQMGPLATTAASTPNGERTTANAWAPHHDDVSPGGSSSGSATAVAARMAASSTGTQTGGSITNPSNAQGLTGIKPTMGRVSLHGILPLTYTRDHPGPLARDAVDAALMLQIMAGPDPADPRSLGLPPVPDYLGAVREDAGGLTHPERGGPVRIGVLPGFLDEPEPPEDPGPDPDPDIDRIGSSFPRRERTQAAYRREVATVEARRRMLATLEEMGAEIVELDFPTHWEALTSFNFNNVRLPERSEIFLEHLRDDVRKFGVSLAPWINGLLLPAAEYVRGSRARLVLLKEVLDEVFGRCDLVTQTAPYPFDMVGLPLIGFPIGFEAGSTGYPRPIGGMFGAEPYAEHHLLAVIAAYQRATDWHLRRPADPGELRPAEGDGGGPRGGADGATGRERLPGRYDLFDVMERGE
ncbi:amidase [Candidatus Palauibacter polyketidifaciens]|uniref:amidase n=1 Tax=Candidatus Palauibacter polyketidifaciens TaxID=3056740 RepID=UPI0023A0018D|nr:amidase [Candidatus Palauibacter polyketidifaciens]MDE2719860.1 amidase [Candidatus Palauibacter polyketidifaciens]